MIRTVDYEIVKDAGWVEECENLMPADAGGLTTVGLATEVVAGRWHPLGEVMLPGEGGKALILISLSKPHRVVARVGALTTTITTLGEMPRSHIAVDGGLMLMLSDGPHRIRYNATEDGWEVINPPSRLPSVRIWAVPQGTLSASTPAMSASIVGGGLLRLEPSALKKLSGYLCDAYDDLISAASHAGLRIQPVVVSCRVLGASGRELMRYEPQLLAPFGGQCMQMVSTSTSRSADKLTIDSVRLSAETYKIGLHIPAMVADEQPEEQPAVLEVSVTHQAHPVDSSRSAYYRFNHPSSDHPELVVALPGATSGSVPVTAQYRREVERLASANRRAAEMVVRFDIGDAVARDVVIGLDAVNDAAASRKAVESACSDFDSSMIGEKLFARLCCAPHCFSAGAVAESGDSIVWGDVSRVSAKPADAVLWAADVADGDWCGVTEVEMADGTWVRSEIEASGAMPTSLLPYVSYPDPSARRLRIFIDGGATRLKAEVALQPASDGVSAYYLSDDLAAIPLEVTDEQIPDERPASDCPGHKMRGGVVVCRKSDPLAVVSALQIGADPIVALTPAVRSQSNWDFSRGHLYAMSRSGIYAVSVSGAKCRLSASIIDPRVVESASLVAYTPLGVAVYVGDKLVVVKASRATVMCRLPGVEQIAWSDEWQRLVCRCSDGRLTMMSLATADRFRLTTGEAVEAIFSVGGRVLALRSSGLYSQPPVAGANEGVWSRRLAFSPGERVEAIELRIDASEFEGDIEVRADGGAGSSNSYPVAKLRIAGQINAPLRMRVAGPARPYLTLSVGGRGVFRLCECRIFVERR